MNPEKFNNMNTGAPRGQRLHSLYIVGGVNLLDFDLTFSRFADLKYIQQLSTMPAANSHDTDSAKAIAILFASSSVLA